MMKEENIVSIETGILIDVLNEMHVCLFFSMINTLDFKSKLNMLELTNTFRTILYKKIAMRIRRELIGV